MPKMWICGNEKCAYFRRLKCNEGFCTTCGEELVDAPTCKCKEPISQYDKFCPICGRPIQTT